MKTKLKVPFLWGTKIKTIINFDFDFFFKWEEVKILKLISAVGILDALPIP
jgi:hypothetical protein